MLKNYKNFLLIKKLVKTKLKPDKSNICNYIPNKNNFDLIRVGLALIVFLVHAASLSGYSSLNPIINFFSAEIAVKSFFIISGFLIFMSYEKSKNITLFFSKRIRRIYPAYFFVIVISTLSGLIYSSASLHEYISFTTLKYLISNLLFLNFIQPNLPGLFVENSIKAVNGALWTLKIEVMFYILVPIIVMVFNRIGRLKAMIGIYIFSLLYSYTLLHFYEIYNLSFLLDLQRQLPGQLTYFIMGALGYYFFECFKKYSVYLLGVAIFLMLFKQSLPWLIFEPGFLLIFILFFATKFYYLGNFNKYGDFSYGIYILHFPILQTLISQHLLDNFHMGFLICSAAIVILLAILLWYLVEKPFLRNNSHYLNRENFGG